MKYCLGIDVGGTTIKMGLFKEDGSLCEKWSIPTTVGENGRFIYDEAAASVRRKMEENSLEMKDILGVGVTMPGPVCSDGKCGYCNNIAVNGGYPAIEISKRLEGVKAVATNDANAAALGEMWMGAGKGYGSLFMATLGTGVGGGFITAGQIVDGIHGAAGEIGHLKVEDNETERCNCGGYGCCEYYASATGMVRVARRLLASGDPLKPAAEDSEILFPDSAMALYGNELTVENICDLAREGDELAVKTLDFAMDKLSRALACVTCVADPEVFIIGGGVSKAGSVIIDRLKEGIVKYSPIVRVKEREVITAELGNDAGIYGAAGLALYNVF